MVYMSGAVLLWSLFGRSLAVIRTVAVDDTNGDEMTGAMPTYLPNATFWFEGPQCGECSAKPSGAQIKDGTWHDTTHSIGIGPDQSAVSIAFVGHSVYVFFITVNINTINGIILTNVTFTIDGNFAGTFTSTPGSDPGYSYNVLGFSTTSLANSSHEILISTTGDASLVLFDYLTYSFDLPDPPPESTSTSTSTFQPSSSIQSSSSTSTLLEQSTVLSSLSQYTGPKTSISSTVPTSGSTTNTTSNSFPTSSSNSSTPARQSPTSSSLVQSSTRKGNNIGMIIGIVFACVFITAILLLYLRKRRLCHNVFRWKRIHSIYGTDSTLVEPARIEHSHMLTYKDSEKSSRLRTDENEVLPVRTADSDRLEYHGPRSSVSLRPSDSASNVRVPPALLANDPQHTGELLSIREKIKVLQEEEQILAIFAS